MRYIVELERGVWIAPWSGDPGRTLDRRNAAVYESRSGAQRALDGACRFRPFLRAAILAIVEGSDTSATPAVGCSCDDGRSCAACRDDLARDETSY